jgi:hypothetical protein
MKISKLKMPLSSPLLQFEGLDFQLFVILFEKLDFQGFVILFEHLNFQSFVTLLELFHIFNSTK